MHRTHRKLVHLFLTSDKNIKEYLIDLVVKGEIIMTDLQMYEKLPFIRMNIKNVRINKVFLVVMQNPVLLKVKKK